MKARLLSLVIGAALMSSATTVAAVSSDEQALIRFLDKEYAPGLLKIGSHGRNRDGNYIWSAIFHRELRKPLEKVTTYCASSGGTIRLLISAGSTLTHPGSTTVNLGGQSFRIGQNDLWEWSGKSGETGERAAFQGFDPLFDRRLVAGRTRTIAEANANPPLGLFGCYSADSILKWAVSIMPGDYGGSGWLYLKILPVTSDLLAAKREATNQASQKERDWQKRQADEQRAREEQDERENVRLAQWRRELRVGSETNCGLVINDRDAVLEVQMPSGNAGPNGERQFWVKRSDLADYPFPKGCNYGR